MCLLSTLQLGSLPACYSPHCLVPSFSLWDTHPHELPTYCMFECPLFCQKLTRTHTLDFIFIYVGKYNLNLWPTFLHVHPGWKGGKSISESIICIGQGCSPLSHTHIQTLVKACNKRSDKEHYLFWFDTYKEPTHSALHHKCDGFVLFHQDPLIGSNYMGHAGF